MKLYLIASALFFFSSHVYAQPTQEETQTQKVASYWKAANLQDSEIKRYINEATCSSDQQVYFGCFSAVSTLVAAVNENANLILSQLPSKPWETGALISYSKFEVRSFNPELFPKKRSLEERQQSLKEEENARKLVASLYKDKSNSQELIKILDDSLAKLTVEKRSQTIAMAVQSYFVYGVDAHAHLHTPSEHRDMMNPEIINETFYGIGATLMQNDEQIQITEPLPNSPAFKAGIQVGDVITGVNGASVLGEKLDKVVAKIKGPKDTNVQLTIQRKDKELIFNITRGAVTVENLSTRVLETKKKEKVVYVQLRTFMENGICNKFINTIEEKLKSENTSNLIIDLRNNGGGLMDEALCMAGAFYRQDGPLLKVWDLNQNRYVQEINYSFSRSAVMQMGAAQVQNISSLLGGKQVVVLINAGSASASEIFAGIMQDMNIGITVGIKSFGKATIQSPGSYMTSDNTELVMFRTIARFHLPTGRTNQISSIKADAEAYNEPNPKPEQTFFMREEQLYSHAVRSAENNYVTPAGVANKISICMKDTNPAAEYDREVQGSGYADYQKLVATELAACL